MLFSLNYIGGYVIALLLMLTLITQSDLPAFSTVERLFFPVHALGPDHTQGRECKHHFLDVG